MAAQLEPVELARLVDLAERPRVEGWSLRSALVRFAQPQPGRASVVLSQVRRIEAAVHNDAKSLRRRGDEVWTAVEGGEPADDLAAVVGVLRVARRLDELADVLAAWAVARDGGRPDGAVDEATAEVARRLDELGVPEESEGPPPGARGRG